MEEDEVSKWVNVFSAIALLEKHCITHCPNKECTTPKDWNNRTRYIGPEGKHICRGCYDKWKRKVGKKRARTE